MPKIKMSGLSKDLKIWYEKTFLDSMEIHILKFKLEHLLSFML